MRTDIIFQRDTEGTTDRIWGFTHLESVFEHPKVIVFPNQKYAQKALLSAAFSPPKWVSFGAFVFLRLVGTLLNRQLHQLAAQAAYAQPQGNHKDDCKGNGQNNTVKRA